MEVSGARQGHSDGERLQEGSVQRRYRHHREDRSRRTGAFDLLRRPAGAIRIRRAGRNLSGLRGDHAQGAGLGVPGGGDSGGHAALHAAPAQPDLYRDHPRQAVARSDWTEKSSGHRGTERPVSQALLRTPEQLVSPQPSESYAAGVTGVFVFGRAAFFAETAFLAGTVCGTTPLGVTLFTAGAAATARASFFAAFFVFAQRAFCAAAIFARASVLRVRLAAGLAADFAGMEFVALPDKFTRDGRHGLRLIVISVPAKSAFASRSREIIASISTMMSVVFIDPLPLRIYELPKHPGAQRRPITEGERPTREPSK